MSKLKLDRRQFMIGSVGLGSSLLLSGCGGLFSSSGGGATANLSGTISLPPGILESDVSVVSLSASRAISAGKFQALASASSPSIAIVLHKPTGKLIAYGMLDSSDLIHTINATSTAQALLFFALGGNSMPTDGRRPLLAAIKASSATTDLAAFIEAQLATDAFAIETANPTLVSALETAANAISSSYGSPLAKPKHQVASDRFAPMAVPLRMLIEPNGEVDGATVVQATDKFGYQVQNSRRRIAQMRTYLVAHVDAQGVRTDVPPALIGSPIDIPSTRSLFNLSSGWHPVMTQTVPLTLQGNDLKSIYELVYLCPVFGANDPQVLGLEKYTNERTALEAALNDLHSGTLLDIVAGIILDILGVGGAVFGIAELTASIAALAPVSTNMYSLLIGAQSGAGILPMVASTLNAFASETLFVTPQMVSKLAPLFNKAAGQAAADLAAGTASTEVYIALRAALRVALAVGVIALVADLGAVAKDTSQGERGDIFTATVIKPTVAISPATQSYVPGNDLPLHAVVTLTGRTLKYHWKMSGSSLANLSDGTHVGIEFDSTSADVNLATTPSTQENITVTVTVTDITDGDSTVVGTATGTYIRGDQNYQDFLIQVVDRGIDGYHTQGFGDVFGYLSVPLNSQSQTRVKLIDVVTDKGTIKMTVDLPVSSTPLPLDKTITAQQIIRPDPHNVSVTNLVDPTFPTYFSAYIPTIWNFGDQVVFVYAITGWTIGAHPPAIGSPAEATAVLREALNNRQGSITSQLI